MVAARRVPAPLVPAAPFVYGDVMPGSPVIKLILAAALLLLVPAPRAQAHDWNDARIQWRTYDDALAVAKKEHKPICLIVFTEWCPHCANYSKVFADPTVVERAKRFVMVHVDSDKEADVAKQFSLDGGYIPRTFFLSSDGKVDPSIQAPRDRYRYFYDEHAPASVLAGMDAALAKLK